MKLPTLKESVEELITNVQNNHPNKWWKLQSGLIQLYDISDAASNDKDMAQQWRMLYDIIKKDLPDDSPAESLHSRAANI